MKPPYLGERCRDVLEVQLHQIPNDGKGSWTRRELSQTFVTFLPHEKKNQASDTNHKNKNSDFQLFHLGYSVLVTGWVVCWQSLIHTQGTICKSKAGLSSWTQETNSLVLVLAVFTFPKLEIGMDSYLSYLSFTKSAIFYFLSLSITCTISFQH